MARQDYALDGNRQFIFPFPVQDASDLRLQLFPGTTVPAEDYVVTGAGPASQGVTVEWPDAPTNLDITLAIIRETPAARVTDFPNNQSVSARALNSEFDNIYQAIVDFIDIIEFQVETILETDLPALVQEEVQPFVDAAAASAASAEEDAATATAAIGTIEDLLSEEIDLQRSALGLASLALFDAASVIIGNTDLGSVAGPAVFANENTPTIEIDLAFDKGPGVNLGEVTV